MHVKVAREADIEAVVRTISLAFVDDPVWSPALASLDGTSQHLATFWGFYVEAAMRYSTIRVLDDCAAVAVWIPPGGTELIESHEHILRDWAGTYLGPELGAALFELGDRFDAAHPQQPPHAFLGLLATHPDHRGKGIGQELLAANLREWDRLDVPTYLESTNPKNNHRYERAGFEPIGAFEAVLSNAVVTTMWRDARRADPLGQVGLSGH